ncbi:unnamed protein product, partial [Durusdinium trenchii]
LETLCNVALAAVMDVAFVRSNGSTSSTPRQDCKFHRLSAMSSQQVGQYMAACGFADYEHLFQEHNISGDRLLQLTSEDLRNIGFVTVGDRLVMQQEIAGIRAGRRIAWRSDSFDLEPLDRPQERMLSSKSEKSQSNLERSEFFKSASQDMPEAARKAKRKAKLKSRSEELRSLRQRFCHAMRVAAAREDGCMGHAILKAWQNCIQTEVRERRLASSNCLRKGIDEVMSKVEPGSVLGIFVSRTSLTQLAVLHAWAHAVVLRRHQVELQAQEEKAGVRSTAALSILRNELRAIRCQRYRTACRMVQQRVSLALCGPFNAWRQQSQQVQSSVASRRLRPGEVLLNSGQAAKRAQQQLQEARAQHAEQICALEREMAELRTEVSAARLAAAAAARGEARAENIARRHACAAKRGEELAALLACMKAWSGELALSRSLAGRKDEVVAAREGRKGLFIAALNQQAKYWRAEAFNAWRRVLLQDRCQQLKDILESRKKVSAQGTPRSAKRQ